MQEPLTWMEILESEHRDIFLDIIAHETRVTTGMPAFKGSKCAEVHGVAKEFDEKLEGFAAYLRDKLNTDKIARSKAERSHDGDRYGSAGDGLHVAVDDPYAMVFDDILRQARFFYQLAEKVKSASRFKVAPLGASINVELKSNKAKPREDALIFLNQLREGPHMISIATSDQDDNGPLLFATLRKTAKLEELLAICEQHPLPQVRVK